MKNNITELVFIIDRSGSMAGFEADTIGGFNSMIEKQKNEGEGTVYVSTVLFDNFSEVLHDRAPIREIKPMTGKDYSVRGYCNGLYCFGYGMESALARLAFFQEGFACSDPG